ncbi:U1 small nuclear ribonucleoprotein C-like [Phyllostomus hastatus]|uniref:U1 small nuclear ribonucleoprotein C-like n=1 Tax=Phyllostomus hastatus TaxID=9423 RepID=UPI001E685736|nr:U1 small nuclear ribonucleoprotein C-like [Phyllostomus hastatus]XP_045678094.1 U1 small nuclear ribonucleoprotein C-like [Phyllostomus hastatus]
MASPRRGRPCCIRAALSATSTRAGFWRRRRNALHRLKAHPKRGHVDLADGVWRELLDPHAGWEDPPAPLARSLKDRSPGDPPCHRPSHAPKPRSPVHPEDSLRSDVPGPLVRAAGGAPVPPGADDGDMQPVEAGGPGAAAPPDGPGVMEGDWGPPLPAAASPEPGRCAQGRARVSRQPPRLGSERDKGHRLSLSKRKLELFLSEPEKRKRRRQHAA